MQSIREIEKQSGTLTILIYLTKKSDSITSIIRYTGITSSSIYRALTKLSDLGLIQDEIDESVRPRKRIISLTKKGRKVAKKLLDVEKILEEK